MKKIIKYQMLGLGAPTAQDLRPTAVSECKSCQKKMQGKIFSSDDNQPLLGAHIINKTRNTGTTSAMDGSYSIVAAPSDDIEISFMGFKTVRGKAAAIPAIIHLNVNIEELDGVTVSPQKKVGVRPSLNEKIKKNKKWIWLGLLALAIGGGAYYYAKSDKK
ncbi:carboxypeptidase-like regulatory domain-containing protein [Capnocytophaga canimorsus]|uniref:carboxypeptidase-like regulatory domain-containing protein n=1 Tax=Capnocytophaga canimorsus TaxID=28188 RepID=UPI003859D61C